YFLCLCSKCKTPGLVSQGGRLTLSGFVGLAAMQSALGFGPFFLHRLFFLFLFLEFVADKFKNRDLRAVANANASGDDARIAASAVRKFRRDVAEKFFGHGSRHDV